MEGLELYTLIEVLLGYRFIGRHYSFIFSSFSYDPEHGMLLFHSYCTPLLILELSYQLQS